MAEETKLNRIDPTLIAANPDNPRLIFREKEMSQLLDSIHRNGIKVPLAVYQEGESYVLIDGERRWRCALRLNLDVVPAIVQPKLERLENILTMFNIHNVRVDWDLMPMALMVAEVREMAAAQGLGTSPQNLAGLTGVPLPTIRRALELLELPKKYQRLLLKEAAKPKEEQEITADLFIEVLKSQRAIKKYVPQVFDAVDEDDYLDSMVEKYRSDVVTNVVAFRDVSRIARAELAGEDPETAAGALVGLIQRPTRTIRQAYDSTVRAGYLTRDLTTRTSGLVERLLMLSEAGDEISSDLRIELQNLRDLIDKLLG